MLFLLFVSANLPGADLERGQRRDQVAWGSLWADREEGGTVQSEGSFRASSGRCADKSAESLGQQSRVHSTPC